jgi:spermidine/putrescine transport system ATP-binding protein
VALPAEALPEGLAPGADATLMMRPEHLRLAPPDAPAAFVGRVELVAYLGASTHVTVRLDGGESLVVEHRGRERGLPAAGEAVGIEAEVGALRVFAAAG